MRKIIIKSVLVVIMLLVYCIPVVLIYGIVDKEKSQYEIIEQFDFDDSAYGDIYQVEKRDVKEYYCFEADVISNTKEHFEVNENAKLTISIGDEVQKNQTIAYYNGSELHIDKMGIIEDISYSAGKMVITVLNLEKLVYECKVKPDMLYLFEGEYVYQENDEEMKIQKISNIMEGDYLNVYLEAPAENIVYYGQHIDKLKIYTGVLMSDVSVIDKSCVYKKENSYYIRRVTETGEFLEETNVKIGIELDDSICVYGVDEGVYCDGGYKDIVNGERNETN